MNERRSDSGVSFLVEKEKCGRSDRIGFFPLGRGLMDLIWIVG
jgi:hypothetical protein